MGRDECYNYTCLIDLQSILNKNWAVFESDFRKVSAATQSKREFLDLLGPLNDVRNRYAHPVRAPRPNTQAFLKDLALAQQVREVFFHFCVSTSLDA